MDFSRFLETKSIGNNIMISKKQLLVWPKIKVKSIMIYGKI